MRNAECRFAQTRRATAGEAAAAAREAKAFASSRLPDDATIADLRQRLHAANYTAPTNTPGELAAGLAHLCNIMPGGYLGTLKSAAIRSQGAITDCRDCARRTLIQTAVDRQPDSTVTALSQQIEQVKDRIAERRPVLQASERNQEQQT